MNSSLHRFVLAFDRIAGLITCPQCLRLNRSGYQLRRSCSLPAFLDAGDPVDTTDLALAIGCNIILLQFRPSLRPCEVEPALGHPPAILSAVAWMGRAAAPQSVN